MFNATIITKYATTGPLPDYIDPVTNLDDNNVPKSILCGAQNGVLVVDGVAEQTKITTLAAAGLNNRYFLISSPSNEYYVWYNVGGLGVDPIASSAELMGSGRIGLQIAVAGGDNAMDVATATALVINGTADFVINPIPAGTDTFIVVNVNQGAVISPPADAALPAFQTGFNIKSPAVLSITVTNCAFGDVTDIADGGVSSVGPGKLCSLVKTTDGTVSSGEVSTIDAAGATPAGLSGAYFELYSPTVDYYVWFNLDGGSADPAPGGFTAIQVSIVTGDSALAIAQKLSDALNAVLDGMAAQVFKATQPDTSNIGEGMTAVGDRILVKDEPSGKLQYNGLYLVQEVGSGTTPWKLIRDFDNINLKKGDIFYTEQGTMNAGSLSILTEDIIVAGELGSPGNFDVIMGSGAVDFDNLAPVSGSDMCGDLIVRTDSSGSAGQGDTWTALAVGSAGQFLRVHPSAATAGAPINQQCLQWTDLTLNELIAMGAAGNMIISSGGAASILPVPTMDKAVLQRDDSSPNGFGNVQWKTLNFEGITPTGSDGDIMVFDGVAGEWITLANPMTNGNVLTVNTAVTGKIEWTSGSASASGPDNAIQFANGVLFDSLTNFEFDPTTNVLAVPQGTPGTTPGRFGVKLGGDSRTLLYAPGNDAATTGNNVAVGDEISTATTYTNTLAFGVGSLGSLTTGSGSIVIGNISGASLTSGSSNIIVGHGALPSAVLSGSNLAIGNNTLSSYNGPTGVTANIAIGEDSLSSLTGGASSVRNTAVGYKALESVTLRRNTAVGYQAAYRSTGSEDMSAFGFEALANNVGGSRSSAFGYRALGNNAGPNAQNDQCAFGYQALGGVTTGIFNNAFGSLAADAVADGSNNNAFGYNSLTANISGSRNSAFGNSSLSAGSAAGFSDNTAFGHESLSRATGNGCTAVGSLALTTLAGGVNNTATGFRAATSTVGSSSLCAYGTRALENATGGNNSNAFGFEALQSSGTGASNNAFGYQALNSNSQSNSCGFGEAVLRTPTRQSCAFGNNAAGDLGLADNTFLHAFGYQALSKNTTGFNNCAFGWRALTDMDTGDNSCAFGNGALASVTTANGNSAFGHLSLNNVTLANNSAFGANSMQNAAATNQNSAFGSQALTMAAPGTGLRNNAFGYQALTAVTTGNNNCALGTESGNAIDTGSDNVLMGYQTGQGLQTQGQCVAIGSYALTNNTPSLTAANNVGIGFAAGTNAVNANQGTFIGANAGGITGIGAALSGNNNVGVGYQALGSVQGASAQNTAVGAGALDSMTVASNNTALGYNAGTNVDTGVGNTIVGANAGNNIDNNSNIIIGINAASTGGVPFTGGATENVIIGSSASRLINDGQDNVVIGPLAAAALTDGNNNILVGCQVAGSLTNGNDNVVIGENAAGALTTGARNVVLGGNQANTAGQTLATGNDNVVIGTGTDLNAAGRSGCVVLGLNAEVSKNNTIGLPAAVVTNTGAGLSAGGGTAPPATPVSYLEVNIGGTVYSIPLYT